MKEYTIDGVWNDANGLDVEFVGVDLSEVTIEGVVADNRSYDAFTHTVEAGSEAEAYRVLGQKMDADSVWDCRNNKRRRVYTQAEDKAEA
ncbi:hypothetical protein ACFU99_05790 [Streptomyces sp. NPDC057654]|uniref:hypothetical protein n=1 Tax=Streptomyces sp. NPDC057654 TaxID=3346196 RepID=UPI0036CAFB3E